MGSGDGRPALTGAVGGGDLPPVAVHPSGVRQQHDRPASGGVGATAAFTELLARGGVRVVVPEGIEALCCSTPWTSKGPGGRDVMPRRLGGARGIGGRPSSGAQRRRQLHRGLREPFADAGVDWQVEDAVSFVAQEMLPRLGDIAPAMDTLALFPTCSSTSLVRTRPLRPWPLRRGERRLRQLGMLRLRRRPRDAPS